MKRLAIAMLAACTSYDVPATPSFQVDVLPIFAANCVSCHGYPTTHGARPWTRWDSYENLHVGDDGIPRPASSCGAPEDTVCGAGPMAGAIASRVELEEMPPRFPLEGFQIETIARWGEQGGLRGAPRADNRPPTIVVEPVEQVGDVVTLAVTARDADHDLVAGELHALVGGERRFVGPIRTGHQTIAWNAAMLDGSFELVARLDDGAGFIEVEVGSLDVR